jgi:hypothetical protein
MLIIIIIFGLGLLVMYERYTATMGLGRLQREADLIVRLEEIQSRVTNAMTPDIIHLNAVLLTNATRTIQEKPISLEFVPSKLTFSFDSLWKCLWGGSLWLVFAIIYLPKSKTKEGRNTIKSFLVLAAISGIVGLFVPPIWWPWFHIFIFPWLLIICVLFAIAPFAIVMANFQKARKAALTNTCINNLRQIDAATNQWALEHSKSVGATPTQVDLLPYLAGSVFPKCPSGGVYKLNSVGLNPVCSEKGHHIQ